MKILLINPDVADGRGYLSYNDGYFKRLLVNPSMTMPYIAALTPPGHDVTIRDEVLGDVIDFDQEVDLVGITVVTQIAHRAYAIADAFLRRGRKVVLGGAHVTLMPEEALAHADAVVVGEAEEVWPRLLQNLQAGRLQQRYARPGLHSLCRLPKPRMDLLRTRYKYLGISMGQVKISRGCPYSCVTCCVPTLYGNRYRQRPLEEVISEIGAVTESVIYFCEDNVVGNPSYAKQLFRQMIPLKKQWTSISSIAIGADPELLELAARSGCKGIYIGFETLSEKTLKEMNKKHNLNKNYKEIIKRVKASGIVLTGGFLVGFDNDTPDTFKQIVDFVADTDIDICQYYIVVPWPKTRFYDQLRKEGRLIHPTWWLEEFYSQQVLYRPARMSAEQLVEGFIYMTEETYRLGKMLPRLFGLKSLGALKRSLKEINNQPLWPQVVQKFSALAMNMAYREVYKGQKDLFAEKRAML